MKLEDTTDPLHSFGQQLFKFIKQLGGPDGAAPVYQKSGWYRAPATGKVCLYLYFLGNRGNSRHKNSVRLTTLWDKEFEGSPWVEKGNNWFGVPSADYYARPDDPHAPQRAEMFIRQAFKVVALDIVSQVVRAEADRKMFREKLGHIANDDAQAPAAASWLKRMLEGTGKATAIAVREILVNVASEVVKKTLLGS
jgi:hypothetical protein